MTLTGGKRTLQDKTVQSATLCTANCTWGRAEVLRRVKIPHRKHTAYKITKIIEEEKVTVYCENYRECLNTGCRENGGSSMLK